MRPCTHSCPAPPGHCMQTFLVLSSFPPALRLDLERMGEALQEPSPAVAPPMQQMSQPMQFVSQPLHGGQGTNGTFSFLGGYAVSDGSGQAAAQFGQFGQGQGQAAAEPMRMGTTATSVLPYGGPPFVLNDQLRPDCTDDIDDLLELC